MTKLAPSWHVELTAAGGAKTLMTGNERSSTDNSYLLDYFYASTRSDWTLEAMRLPGQTGRWKLCLYQARLDGGSYASTRPDWTVEAMPLPGQTGQWKLNVLRSFPRLLPNLRT